MTAKQTKFSFMLSRFKGFLKQLFRSKTAVFGVVILMFFILFAAFAPLLGSYDPIAFGSVTVGEAPIAYQLCYPEWYRFFPGQENLTRTIYIMPDPRYDTEASITDNWRVKTVGGATYKYNGTYGNEKGGSLEIAFSDKGNITLARTFTYDQLPPTLFHGRIAYLVYGENTTATSLEDLKTNPSLAKVTLKIWLDYEGKTVYPLLPCPPKEFPQTPKTIKFENKTSFTKEYSAIDAGNSQIQNRYGYNPEKVLFSLKGNYTYYIQIGFEGTHTEYVKNVKVFVDETNFILYGQTFGLLGTDHLRRDIFSQLAWGARISLFIGLVAAVVSIVIGLVVGLVAGFVGKALDEILMRFTDMLLVLPTLPLLMVLVFSLGPNIINIILVVGFLGWMGFARTVRSSVLSLKERPFVESAKASGAGLGYILRKHILPNVFTLVYVSLALSVPSAIISEAALSWLGLGANDVMSWGKMLFEFQRSGLMASGALTYWYWTVFPGICIALLSLSFILLGYAMDEILNPRLRQRR